MSSSSDLVVRRSSVEQIRARAGSPDSIGGRRYFARTWRFERGAAVALSLDERVREFEPGIIAA
jgi:hypothetical protein